jgi:hypothetical protein
MTSLDGPPISLCSYSSPAICTQELLSGCSGCQTNSIVLSLRWPGRPAQSSDVKKGEWAKSIHLAVLQSGVISACVDRLGCVGAQHLRNQHVPDGWPTQACFGLSGAVLQLDRVSLFRVSCRLFRLDDDLALMPG